MLPITHTLNCRGRLLSLDTPRIMGILNVTPDSFSDGGAFETVEAALSHTEQMLAEGADIIDIGGASSRPKSEVVMPDEEIRRISPVVEAILAEFPETIVSIDTFYPQVASAMLEVGAHIINDISAGTALGRLHPSDPDMMQILAQYPNVPYVMMHMKGAPQDMQENPVYEDVVGEVWQFFVEKINQARAAGLRDLIIDPGFGFGKTILHNYQLWGGLAQFREAGLPVLVGLSRKSMLYKLLQTEPRDVMAAASALHFQALQAGAQLLRVHDVKEAKQTVKVFSYLRTHEII